MLLPKIEMTEIQIITIYPRLPVHRTDADTEIICGIPSVILWHEDCGPQWQTWSSPTEVPSDFPNTQESIQKKACMFSASNPQYFFSFCKWEK